MIEIYTDGACIGNPGKGGWAAIILENASKRVIQGNETHTTNNRMEILAVIKGLEAVPELVDVKVFSDSQYVVKTMTLNWKRKANEDLWGRLDVETGKRRVAWEWVKGHSDNILNREVDAVARREAYMVDDTTDTISNEEFTHIDDYGNAQMVDITQKLTTERIAVAEASVVMRPETLASIKDLEIGKGDVLSIARIAGIMAAKNTPQLIPLCHPIPIESIGVSFIMNDEENTINITATARTTAKTGIEMEAMVAVSVAALTIYDMCKGTDRTMRFEGVRLVEKRGGRSGDIVLGGSDQ